MISSFYHYRRFFIQGNQHQRNLVMCFTPRISVKHFIGPFLISLAYNLRQINNFGITGRITRIVYIVICSIYYFYE